MKLSTIKLGLEALKGLALSHLGRNIPLRVSLMVTYRCNLRCDYCGWPDRAGAEMTTAQLKQCMREFRDMGAVNIGISGGEALLRDDFGDLVASGKALGFIVSVITNGLLVPKKLDELRPVDLLMISLDGPREVNDTIRGRGSFDRAVEAIRQARSVGINTSIITVLSSENLADGGEKLKELLELVRELDCKLIVQPLYSDPYNRDMSLGVDREDYRHGLRLLEEFKRRHPRRLLHSRAELRWFGRLFDPDARWTCKAGKLYCVVYPDGSVYPCNIREDEGVNGLKVGFRNAVKALESHHPGCTCFLSCYTKYNHLLSLRPSSILDDIRNLLD